MAYKKCPLCREKIVSGKENMIRHIEKEHESEIPTGQTSGEFLYLSEHGGQPRKCMICKKPTTWNNAANKYNAFCSEKCKWEYVKLARARNKRVYGKENLLNDPEQQKKMLANRSISGKYRHSDGGVLTYTGTYEEDFCHMMDSFLNYPSNDIVMPSPHVYEYKYKGEKKFYFPDAFIPSLNLEIEIKDGGNNPNMHHKIQDVDKVKEHLKDEAMMKQKDFHYIKIENKDYDAFFKLVEKLASDDLSDMERIRKIKIIPEQKTATYEQVEDIFLFIDEDIVTEDYKIGVYRKEYKSMEDFCYKFDTFQDVVTWFQANGVRWPKYKERDKEGPVDWMGEVHWPEDILRDKTGNCFDQALFVYYFCKYHGIPCRIYRFSRYYDPTGTSKESTLYCSTHFVTILKQLPGYYVFSYHGKHNDTSGPYESYEKAVEKYEEHLLQMFMMLVAAQNGNEGMNVISKDKNMCRIIKRNGYFTEDDMAFFDKTYGDKRLTQIEYIEKSQGCKFPEDRKVIKHTPLELVYSNIRYGVSKVGEKLTKFLINKE